jgi:hypothetical protein
MSQPLYPGEGAMEPIKYEAEYGEEKTHCHCWNLNPDLC